MWRWRLAQRKVLLAFWFSMPVKLACSLPLRTASLLPHSAFSALVPVQSPSFSLNVTGMIVMKTGRIASKAGLLP